MYAEPCAARGRGAARRPLESGSGKTRGVVVFVGEERGGVFVGEARSRQGYPRSACRRVGRLSSSVCNKVTRDRTSVVYVALGLQPEAPAELEAYRTRVLHEAIFGL